MNLERAIVVYMKGWVDGYIKHAGEQALYSSRFKDAAAKAAEKCQRDLFSMSVPEDEA